MNYFIKIILKLSLVAFTSEIERRANYQIIFENCVSPHNTNWLQNSYANCYVTILQLCSPTWPA